MALFGSTDEYVPVLTAFYQAEPSPEKQVGGELDVLLDRYTFGIPHGTGLWSMRRKEGAEKALQTIAALHDITVRMMDAAADHALPSDTDLSEFNHLLSIALAPPQFEKNGWPSTFRRPGVPYNLTIIPKKFGAPFLEAYTNPEVGRAELVVRHRSPLVGDKTDAEAEAGAFLTEVLNDFVKAYQADGFTRCEECKHPFPLNRAGVRFCSKRCVERNGTRKRRAKKKVLLAGDLQTSGV